MENTSVFSVFMRQLIVLHLLERHCVFNYKMTIIGLTLVRTAESVFWCNLIENV